MFVKISILYNQKRKHNKNKYQVQVYQSQCFIYLYGYITSWIFNEQLIIEVSILWWQSLLLRLIEYTFIFFNWPKMSISVIIRAKSFDLSSGMEIPIFDCYQSQHWKWPIVTVVGDPINDILVATLIRATTLWVIFSPIFFINPQKVTLNRA